jgi:hypothetical protein
MHSKEYLYSLNLVIQVFNYCVDSITMIGFSLVTKNIYMTETFLRQRIYDIAKKISLCVISMIMFLRNTLNVNIE